MKKNIFCLLLAYFFFVACSNKDDKGTKPEELKKRVSESAQLPAMGDEKVVEYDQIMNQGHCHYRVQKHSWVSYVQGSRIETENEMDYQLVNTTGAGCRAQFSESRREVAQADYLRNQLLSKIDQLTDPQLFTILIPEARGAQVMSIRQANYKKMKVAQVEVQYTNSSDSRFYKYIGIISLDSVFLGEFEHKIQTMANEQIEIQELKSAKVGSAGVQYP